MKAGSTLSVVEKGAEAMKSFQPDVILALGGGSPMDAAKIMWVMYEHPETHFEELAMRFMDIRKRIYKFLKWVQSWACMYHYNFRYWFRGYSIRCYLQTTRLVLSTH